MTPQTLTTSTQTQDDRTEGESPVALQSAHPNGRHDTFVLDKNRALRAMLGKNAPTPDETALPKKKVTLLVRGIPEHITLSSEPLILGRMEMKMHGFQPDVDLSAYGAQARGVSRVHARLSFEDDQLYIVDLYSTNGTFVGGQRLEPNEPFRLRDGEEVLLASLLVQIVFE